MACSSVCNHRIVPHRWVVIARATLGSARTPAMLLPPGCEGLRVRRMPVWWTFRRPAWGAQFPANLLRNALLDVTTIMSATAYYRRVTTRDTVGIATSC